jgi:UDPglucose--hexose-1-phosphate uridylyltransferase
VAEGRVPVCPFCNNHEEAVYQLTKSEIRSTKFETNTNVQNTKKQNNASFGHSNFAIVSDFDIRDSNLQPEWLVKVVKNKFPFANTHEIVIHSPFHTKNFEHLPIGHISLILQTYRHRYNEHSHSGQVYIFHNRGKKAGESLPHPHTQITVVPDKVYLDLPQLKSVIPNPPRHSGLDPESHGILKQVQDDKVLTTDHFTLFCPETSQWPDEVWVAPKRTGTTFGEITDDEIDDLAHVLFSLITIYDLRYQHDFPFNFYIYPGNNWYLRLFPRKKTLGGFEVGTGVMVNTQDPKETMEFIKTHFHKPEIEKILHEHLADYHKRV